MSASFALRDLDSAQFEEQRSFSCAKNDINKSDTSLAAPQKIGQYSLIEEKETAARTVIFDDSNLSYLWLPPRDRPFSFDLSESYDKYQHINWCAASNVKLDELLQWILRNQNLLRNGGPRPINADFITYRGVLTKLLVTSFVNDKWLIGATKFKGSIYLCPYYETENRNEYANELSFGGHRFEHFLTRNADKSEQGPFTSQKDEFSVVMRTKLQSAIGKIYLLYAAEVDCLDVGKTDTKEMRNFVEIKTTRKINNENQFRNFQRFKLIKWWAQSYLIGVPKIICGYKDDRHIVDQIEQFDVHQIPQRCSQYWTRRECLNFLYQFLAFVQRTVRDDDPALVYLFSNENGNVISTRKLLSSNHFQILPDSYIKGLV